ncbi:sensor histidine kinase [Flagellimonas crocea]|uniref:sensor histidine kinase n=1 Tax=Flagellimonas crocea TaxID=3067311 RepID=UPI00296FF924|nr:histidine kinase [Muricauda sp. DH64]
MVEKALEQGYLEYFYLYPFQNGFFIFTLGFLFSLTVYHFLLYFQQRDTLYLYYSGYTFFIIMSQLIHLDGGFLYHLLWPVRGVARYPMVFVEIYYALYTVFALKFLNIKTALPKWNRFIMRALYLLILYCVVLIVLYLITGDYDILLKGYFVFTILMILLGLIIYIPFFKVDSPLKYYMISGSFLLLIFSAASLAIYTHLKILDEPVERAYSVLYVGYILENVLFSLGLGYKQKLILDERNRSQERLIAQFKENEDLRLKVQAQLEENVKAMEVKAEAERLKGLKTQYDKELAELKLLALRSQMNPHFIFNSLNSIKRYIIDNDKEKAVYYMNKFAKLIRRILASTMEKESSLKDELETMELYVNIENLRFNHKIHFKIHCDDDIALNGLKIPSLLLQPFLENAIWHGLSPKKTDMELQVSLYKPNDAEIRIEIRDNGIGLTKSRKIKERKVHKNDSVGISLSRERLEHFSKKYQGNGSITITDLQELNQGGTGTQVMISLPTKLNEP